jgi:hypothetical protein
VQSKVTRVHVQAQLHARRGEGQEAAHFYRLSLQRSSEAGSTGPPDIEALSFLAQFLIDSSRPSEAEPLALQMLEGGPAAKERAKGMLRYIRAAQVGTPHGAAGTPVGLGGPSR